MRRGLSTKASDSPWQYHIRYIIWPESPVCQFCCNVSWRRLLLDSGTRRWIMAAMAQNNYKGLYAIWLNQYMIIFAAIFVIRLFPPLGYSTFVPVILYPFIQITFVNKISSTFWSKNMIIFLVLFFLNSVFHVMPFGSRIIIKLELLCLSLRVH